MNKKIIILSVIVIIGIVIGVMFFNTNEEKNEENVFVMNFMWTRGEKVCAMTDFCLANFPVTKQHP